jgi:hypothetical protein
MKQAAQTYRADDGVVKSQVYAKGACSRRARRSSDSAVVTARRFTSARACGIA